MSPESKDQLAVTPEVVAWARGRAGFSVDEAQRYFRRIAEWESGKSGPTYPQLEAMADKFKCPIAVFFFPAPPAIEPPERTFRTLGAEDFENIPRTVKSFLRRGQAMQLNLGELSDANNPAKRIITRELQFQVDTPVSQIVAEVRRYLGIDLGQQIAWRTVDEALEMWRDALAKAGVYVFKEAFRANGYFGFCLYDEDFPIIYVNNSCAKSRQIFTIFHELAHLLFHTNGIDVADDSYIELLEEENRKIEIVCNAFAAEFLVPTDDFQTELARGGAPRDIAARLADRYKVSREVVYRKMRDRRLVSSAEYTKAAAEWAAQRKPNQSGGNYYYNQFAYLGPHYIDLALSQFHQGRFGEERLADYLNIKPRSVLAFEYEYEATR
jgi:Zn-dependent peptidase ImmA (M78 family)